MVLTGERVVLRPLDEDDAGALEAIFAEDAVAPWWPGYDRARIDNDLLGADGDTKVYAIEVDGHAENGIAGVIQSWEESDPEYRHAGIDIALATRWHGTGVAVDALRTLARHLFEDDGHHRLTIDPAASNARAIACYTKIGFRPVGVLRRYEVLGDGTFRDGLLMDLLAGELR